MSDAFAPALPHGAIQELFPDVFQVMGSIVMKPFFRFGRNMTIVRSGSSLTILNSVRLDEDGLRALEELGKVTHVIKLGAFHGVDDAFYVSRYGAAYHLIDGDDPPAGIERFEVISEDTELPVPGASMFLFKTTSKPEGLLRLDREGGILVSCDALQNIPEPDMYCNLASKLVMRMMGFFHPHNIGPGWVKQAKPSAGDFERLRTIEFEHVLCGHGDPVIGEAKSKYAASIRKHFNVA